MTDYATAFQLALARTAAFDLPTPTPFVPQRRRWLTDAVKAHLGEVIFPALDWPAPETVAAYGFSAHARLIEPLTDFFGVPVYFTLGAVSAPGVRTAPPAEADLAQWLSAPPRILTLASWLTLPSFEIVNIVFPTKRRLALRECDGRISLYAHHPDEIEGISHRPLLVGADYLRRLDVDAYEGKWVAFLHPPQY